ncbi:unnamed protein product [Paramecium pentaurelia]|uniref:Uncharacterized protein n=1 Tax=Paramecium pentaurelia TaxID=43138 RepID=A0A8S1SMR7_9CILI|nr:unnamed protein product [Paramecium pentaurelia]
MIIQLFILQVAKAQIQEWDNYYNAFVNNNMSESESWLIIGAFNQNYIKDCSGQNIFGGYTTFGVGTAVYQLFYLPPHYQIRIKLNFWKLGCWENERLYIIIDELVWQQQFTCSQGTSQCGYSFNDLQFPIEIITPHKSETLVILLKASLDGISDESWGFNNFYIDILKCAPDCLLCNENSSDICKPGMDIPIEWISKINVEGWLLKNALPAQSTTCLDKISLIGGYQILRNSDLLITKIILDPHYLLKFQVKIWLIDIQGLANSFNIAIDGIKYALNINSVGSISLCTLSPQESIQNIDWNFTHQNPEIEFQFIPTSLVGSNSFWALFNFNLFIFKCHSNCIKCLGILKTDCQICAEEWIKEDGECNRIQNPLKITKAQTQYIFNQSISIPFLFKLQQIEFPNNSGYFKRDENKIEFEVKVQCVNNGYIKTVMQFCHSCKGYNVYSQTFQCDASKQTIIYFQIQLEKLNITSKEEYLITTNNTYFLMEQVYYNRVIRYGKILEISLLNE